MKPQKIDRKDPAFIADIVPKRIVYAIPGMDQVEVRKNLIYQSADEVELEADIYLPLSLPEGEHRPAILFIHGGPLPPDLLTQPKEWGCFVSYGQLAAASGYVGVTFNHRFYGGDHLDTAMSDINDLVAYVRGHAEALHIDKERIALWAFSGGGPFLSQVIRDVPPYIRCVISYYAQLDLKPLRQYIPTEITDETLDRFSPASQAHKGMAPMFIARAGLDYPGLNESVDRFLQAALAVNATLDLSNHAEGHHSFDILDDNDRSREIIRHTLSFIEAHI